MIVNNLPALQVVIPLMAAPLCSLIPARNFAWLFAALACFVSFACSIALFNQVNTSGIITYAMGSWPEPFGIEYKVDMLNSFMLIIVSGIAAITIVYGYKSVDSEIAPEKQPLFFTMFLLCLAGLLGITITNDAFNIYVFLEISSLATYALIAMGKDRRALTASFEYLILGTVGATFILIAIGLLYMMTGTLNISDLAIHIPDIADKTPVQAALVFFVVGLALKIAIFPIHIWLTNAYTNSPSFIASFLSATATKVNVYVLIRVTLFIFGYKFSFKVIPLGEMLISLSVLAVIIASCIAVYQDNIKRMLAYSSVAQIGYIIIGLGLANKSGIMSSLIYMFNHAIAKSALFMAVGCVYLRTGGVRLCDFKGIGKLMPWTMSAFIISGFSLIGVPATAGFISKWYLLKAVAEQEMWYLLAVIAVSSFIALIYVWRVVEAAYFKPRNIHLEQIREAPVVILVPLWIMTILSVYFGIDSMFITETAEKIAEYVIERG